MRQRATAFSRLFHTHSLQANMTISYVWLTVSSLLFLEICGMLLNGISIWQLNGQLLRNSIVLLVVTVAIGGLFGFLTCRPVIKRIYTLLAATTLFAGGDYAQRVQVTYPDEIGQLEQYFNRMVEQSVENMAMRQELAEQNACMVERARISRDLHDAISQELFSLRTLADGLDMAMQSGAQVTDLEPHIKMLRQAAMTMTDEMRALLLEMRPPLLDGLSFSAALEELASLYMSRLGITVRTSLLPLSFDPEVENALVRISQEALHNAARHAKATMITLSLSQEGDTIVLSIEDDGRGFRADELEQKRGLGLRMMQERVREIQGRFCLDSVPDQGTRIQVSLDREMGT
ncbi:MAG: sensor histidine kinase [Chloroflexota bacterium]|nr:sensor histidine kinase [Chloroflexota bacterium]